MYRSSLAVIHLEIIYLKMLNQMVNNGTNKQLSLHGWFSNSISWCHHSHNPLPCSADCPKSDPISPNLAPPSPEYCIYLKSTVYSCWFMVLKERVYCIPACLRLPGLQLLFFLSFFWLDYYSSSFHTVHSQVYFLRRMLSTCTFQNTHFFCFPSNTGCRL